MIRLSGTCALLAVVGLGALAAPADAGPILFVGTTLNASQKNHANRFNRDGLASFCGDTSSAPTETTFPPSTRFRYSAHDFESLINESACVTVTLTTSCSGPNAIMSETYSPAYDPANIRANWIGDLGNSPPAQTAYSFTAAAGGTFQTVVDESEPGADCGGVGFVISADRPWAAFLPGVKGIPAVGRTLTVERNIWSPHDAAVERQWVRCDTAGANCTDIAGATGPGYVVTSADVGRRIAVREAATDTGNGLRSTVDRGEPTTPVFIPFESHEGGLVAGDLARAGRLAPTQPASRCGTTKSAPALAGPNDLEFYDSYPLTSLLNEPACVWVGQASSQCSTGTLAIYAPGFVPGLTTQDYVADDATEDLLSSTLPAGGRADVVIADNFSGSVCPSYALVLGSDGPFATTRPAVSGNAAVGGSLSTSDGTWSGVPAYSYEWLRCDAGGGSCVPIGAAASAAYTPTDADLGRRLKSRVTATQAGRSASSDSQPSEVIAARAAGPGPPPGPGGPGPGGVTPGDTLAPRATLRFKPADARRALRRSRLPVVATCSERCSLTVELRITSKLAKKYRLGKRVVIGKASGSLTAGRGRTLTVKLTSLATKRLKRARSLKVTIAAVARDGAGNRGSATAKATLSRKR